MSVPLRGRRRAVVDLEAVVRRLHGRFTSTLHDEQVAARLGLALGILFSTCALTGAYSHLLQHPIGWLDIPSRPAGLYRITQGIHVTAGFATIPVLLAKLWVVAPKLVEWPPVRGGQHALERLLLLPLVGGGVFLLFTGVSNVARWYPWRFFFPSGHYWAAWILIGAMVVHIGATWATSSRVLRGPTQERRSGRGAERREARGPAETDRRRFLGGVAATSGILALATLGGTVSWLSPFGFLAQRRAGTGPQGIPVNQTAAQAKVLESAADPAWRLAITGRVAAPRSFSADELAAMPQREAVLPIACVEGWSAEARWSGVPVRHLLELVGARPGAEVRVHSLEEGSPYSTSELNHFQAHDRDTLLATHLQGERLELDHGYPIRLIGPNRPGVAQTKWVRELEVI